ncbi:hypothetical protein [Nostoc sp.]|uniref:hypothetical protein n=1 Tax=Nostoc sp. TaxID=1180 RepID=UPI002FF64AC1
MDFGLSCGTLRVACFPVGVRLRSELISTLSSFIPTPIFSLRSLFCTLLGNGVMGLG